MSDVTHSQWESRVWDLMWVAATGRSTNGELDRLSAEHPDEYKRLRDEFLNVACDLDLNL
jgi:hypothetical protein